MDLLSFASRALAQTFQRGSLQVDTNKPVPVPYNLGFGLGPAGEFTATGFVFAIIDVLLLVAGVIAVLFLIIGGFRYITAHGNEEQAEGAKKTILHAIIGLIVIILSFVIVQVISQALLTGTA